MSNHDTEWMLRDETCLRRRADADRDKAEARVLERDERIRELEQELDAAEQREASLIDDVQQARLERDRWRDQCERALHSDEATQARAEQAEKDVAVLRETVETLATGRAIDFLRGQCEGLGWARSSLNLDRRGERCLEVRLAECRDELAQLQAPPSEVAAPDEARPQDEAMSRG